MAQRSPLYQTRELSERTWPDFERLFSRGNGWDHCWCTAFERVPHPSRKAFRTRAELGVRNHQAKQELVAAGRSHGILVYANGEPVGWCQYGSGDELHGRGRAESMAADTSDTVMADNAERLKSDTSDTVMADNVERLKSDNGGGVWRVTCFVVDRHHRRNGVAGLALRAALETIRNSGGGLVEAYPVACWTHGRNRSAGPVHVQGVGPVAPAWGSFGNVSTSGVVSMFETEGFEAVGVCGSASSRVRSQGAQGCHVLMHKVV
jgi:hypothetical protein